MPSAITADGLATCLDTSLLFAAALEGLGLNPVVLLFDGHATAGVWLTRRSLAAAIEPDAMELRKAIRSGELLVFETTTVTQRPAATLEMARASAEARLAETKAHEFVAAIDIARSRSGGITPLASHSARDPVDGAAEGGVMPPPLPPLPGEGVQPREEVEVKPTTAAARIDRWQKKLLDLTLRNRLLNFVDGKKTILLSPRYLLSGGPPRRGRADPPRSRCRSRIRSAAATRRFTGTRMAASCRRASPPMR